MKRFILIVIAILVITSLAFAHGDAEHIMGTVTKVSDKSITVETMDKHKVTVTVVAETKFTAGAAAATLKDVKLGSRVVIHAHDKGQLLQADSVQIGSASLASSNHPSPRPMPGMKMSAQKSKSARTSAQHSMPGMEMANANPAAQTAKDSMPGMNMAKTNPPQPAAEGSMPGMEMAKPETTPWHGNPQPGELDNGLQQASPRVQAPELLKEAAGRPVMGLKDFEALAVASNPALQQAQALVKRSAGQARQAGLYPNPTVGYVGEELRGGSFGGGQNGAFIQQSIVLGGKRGLRRRIFEEQRRGDEIGVTEQRYRLLGDVDGGFYSALAAQEFVGLRQNLLKIAQDAVETARQLANVGQADAPDLLQSEVEAEQAAAEYVTAQRRYLQAFNTLAALAGKPELPVTGLQGDLEDWPKLDPEQSLATIVRDSPSVKRAQQAVEQAEAELRSARRESVPDLSLRAGIRQDNELLNDASPRPTRVGLVGFATVGVSIPIFNRNQGNVQTATAEMARAREEVARVQLSTRRLAQPLIQSYLAAQDEAERYQSDMIPRAARAYQLYLNKYQQMASAYPQVLISQRTLFQLRAGYVAALEELWVNATALQNFNLSGGLDSPAPSGNPSTNINLPNRSGGID